jgi:hypothetical protein
VPCSDRIARRVALLVACAVVSLPALPAAQAADQVVSGTVEPTLGISLDAGGTVSGTALATVTRQQRGDVTVITVIPR